MAKKKPNSTFEGEYKIPTDSNEDIVLEVSFVNVRAAISSVRIKGIISRKMNDDFRINLGPADNLIGKRLKIDSFTIGVTTNERVSTAKFSIGTGNNVWEGNGEPGDANFYYVGIDFI